MRSGNDSLHARIPDRAQRTSNTDELRTGVGSVTAMERMKADRAIRYKHQHGIPGALPDNEEGQAAQR